MKKIFTLLAFVIAVAACTTEEANVNQFESQDISKMSDTDFIAFMEIMAISRNALPSELNPDDSFYPFPIESITTYGQEKNIPGGGPLDPTNGSCIVRDLNLPRAGSVGEFEIKKFADNSVQGNGNVKLDFKYTAAPGWYIYSISMNIVEDCNSTPLLNNGEPDVCGFNIRNCFSGTRTGITYRFAENCIPDCACIAAYVVMYTLDENGSVDQCVGVWVDGEQLGSSNTGKSNSFCKLNCGETQAS